ncbi:MAG: ATP-binding cassette domain-containing protein [Zetaproteobacteria bacterium]|nr:MAG: ATP-binding cassette domain-containing protein [Zetaproteobacteria bacterium]
MIQAERLTRYFNDSAAVRDLSFHVSHGEVMGLLGPNGAGKSTTMKMLTCFLPPSHGSARIDGLPLERSLEVRRRIGYLPENAPTYPDLDVHSHLAFVGRMHGLSRATLEDRIREMSEVCGIAQVQHRRIDELSKGYRQRVGLAAAMLHDPACLILDEPTTGLDPNQIVEIRQLIRRLGERKTVLLSSHVLSEVEAVCDRMMILDQGELKALGTRADLARLSGGGACMLVRFAGDGQQAMARLADEHDELAVENNGDAWMVRHPDPDFPLGERVFHAAVSSSCVIVEMRRQQTSLEDVFRRLTSEGGSRS